jgi:hypothetical protein
MKLRFGLSLMMQMMNFGMSRHFVISEDGWASLCKPQGASWVAGLSACSMASNQTGTSH